MKRVPELPDTFTNIHPAFFKKKNPSPPPSTLTDLPGASVLRSQIALEYEWLEKITVTEGPVSTEESNRCRGGAGVVRDGKECVSGCS